MAATAILIVDDEQDTCASLSDIISDLGYQVGVAYDGPSALELSRRHPYGLAPLDYQMPGMTGVELYGHLTAGARTRSWPRIMGYERPTL
jgi:CheY-like chemotaxis protein